MSDSFDTYSTFPPEFFEHYASGYEAQRLQSGSSQIELARTQELMMRYLPEPPAVIFDVGGGEWFQIGKDITHRRTIMAGRLCDRELLGSEAA